MGNEVITVDGEVVPDAPSGGESLAIRLSRAEIDQQIATARAYPRDVAMVTKRITALATMSKEAAASMLYNLPRSDKNIEGPGIRFAEIVAQCFGNNRQGARVVEVDRKNKMLVAAGIFHDLETNSMTEKRVQRRISNKSGYLFSDDMIVVTGNAACSIALRNAILGGVPRVLWWPAYERAVQIVAGRPEDAGRRLEQAIRWFASQGADEAQLLAALRLEDKSKVLPEHIVRLEGMASALKNNEATLEELLRIKETAASHEVVDNPLADAPATGAPPAAGVKAGKKPAAAETKAKEQPL
jgi:hypothetical protein